MSERRVVFVVFPDFQILDLTGPHEVFAQVGRLAGAVGHREPGATPGPGYALTTVATSGDPVTASGGITVTPTASLDGVAEVDTLVVVGGRGVTAACADARLVAWIAATAARARRVASVCTGAFLLARAGLLDGRHATTHWAAATRLAREYPAIAVSADSIFVRDGVVWTSAGVTAGIDLALALVEDDLGLAMARAIARQLVVFLQRPGGQAQFSAQLAVRRPESPSLRRLQSFIAEYPAADLGVAALAARAGMSERNFARVFAAEIGSTPASYVESVRVEAARRSLETSDTTIEAIARSCGFGTVATFHRAFQRIVGVTPGQYRQRFALSGSGVVPAAAQSGHE